MQEFDETKPIRDLLKTFESEAPEFNSLFEGEVLGDVSLRQICQSKLADFKTEASSFDQMFANETLVKVTLKKRMVPMWIAIGAAAACTAFMLLLPKETQIERGTIGKMEQTAVRKASVKVRKAQIVYEIKDTLIQKLESPQEIEVLAIEEQELPIREKLMTYQEEQVNRDSLKDNTTKIHPTKRSNIAVAYERSVEEAYAEAKTKKVKVKRDKLILGTGLNSANRLLSLVNTKSADSYPLQSIANEYSSGYASLKGSSSSLLRSATISRNAWVDPENLTSISNLSDYNAVYSLPINFGLSVSFPFFNRFEIMTGLSYTNLRATISGKNATSSFDLKQELHYLGIPLKMSVIFLKQEHFGAYVSFGGTIEKALAGVQKSHVVNTNGEISDWENSQPVYGLQPSIGGQLGVYYELSKTFNLYVEPGASYYIPNDQPISNRTEEPFNFNLGVGLRYRIN